MPDTLTDFEQLVLLAVLQAGQDAYGAALQDVIAERAGRSVTLGSLYNALVRLEERGLASSGRGEPSPVRGGKAKRLFRVTPEGREALAEARRAYERMWEGLPTAAEGG
jgi:DNA-binding PadR family transcriptional regulator